MKKTNVYLLICFCLFGLQPSFAQDIITIQHSCSFDGDETNKDFYVFNASKEAEKIVGEIVNAVGLSKNFVVKSSDCKNALATSEGKQRYILYNTSFLEDFKKDAKTKWAAYCVMAHEIGHHLNNDDFEETDTRKRKLMELKADKFAGSILFNLGASLEEAKAGINILQTIGESETHPPARARAEAIANGWKSSQERHEGLSNNQQDPAETPTKKEPIKKEPEKTAEHRTPPASKKESYDPNYKPEQPADPNPNFNEVSDLLLASQILGNWQCGWYNNYGAYVTTYIGLYQNGSMGADLYINGVLTNSAMEVWAVKNGYFIETNPQTGIYYTYKLEVFNTNAFSVTFVETNGPLVVPIGTRFNYTRTY